MKTDDDTVLSLDRLAVLIHKLEREEEDGDGVRGEFSAVFFIGPRYPWSDLWVQASLTE